MSEAIKEGSLAPYLTIDGAAEAIAFYEEVLGATVTNKMMAEDGKRIMHASLMIGRSNIMVCDEFPEFGGYGGPDKQKGSSVAVSLTLKQASDVDRIYDHALEKGGTKGWAPEDMFWGDRFAQFIDPKGHRWMLVAALKEK